MDGIHDMGGMHGFGRIEIEENEPVFTNRGKGALRVLQGTSGRPFRAVPVIR